MRFALLVGGVGAPNTVIISVLERTGDRLAAGVGATRGQIRIQFLTEALLLSALSRLGGVLLSVAVRPPPRADGPGHL